MSTPILGTGSFPILGTSRKRKRGKVFGFDKFCHTGCPINPMSNFCDNIRVFLQECAELEAYNVNGLSIWCTQLILGNDASVLIPLFTIEESSNHVCNHCKGTGWRNCSVGKRRYHFVIPIDGWWGKTLTDDFLDVQTHLLHGLIRCNGSGQLICVNGIEGGSKNLRGREIMDLWDRICTVLRAGKITVEDLSKKRCMDLRLLLGVACGHSWFGRWDYRCCDENYERAIQTLGSLELDKIIYDFSCADRCSVIRRIFQYYCDVSETKLVTLRDILGSMLAVKSRGPANISTTRAPPQFKNFSAISTSGWDAARLAYTAEVIVKILKEDRAREGTHDGMCVKDLRTAARRFIDDNALLDYVIKRMNNVIFGNHVVCHLSTSSNRQHDFSVMEYGKGTIGLESEVLANPLPEQAIVPGADVYKDVAYLYINVLLNYPASELVAAATNAALDSKNFIKEYLVLNKG